MPLNVSYKNRIGYCTLHSQDKQHKWKIWFCHANCMCAMIYFYNEVENGKRVPMTQLHGFFLDSDHAKGLIKRDFFTNYTNFHFYEKEMDSRMWQLVKIMTQHGIKVTIE